MDYIVKNIDYDYMGLRKAISALCEEYQFLIYSIAGRSCAGRDIPMLRIGRAKEYVLMCAAFHGSEHITSNALLYFTERLCAAIKSDGEIAGFKVRRAIEGRGLIIMPVINPDGVEISVHGKAGCSFAHEKIHKLCAGDFTHWNANLRGVDINHNFAAGWQELKRLEEKAGIFGPAMTRFGGFSPMSEPETLALSEVCRTLRIRHAAAFHSQGEVIYWNYGDTEPPRSRKMAEILATSSGYTLDIPTGLAVGGGFKDWFITEFCRPGFTIEIGKGENPLPQEDFYSIYGRIEEMMMLLTVM